jgi:DNA-binding transcriptional LysR family regulator
MDVAVLQLFVEVVRQGSFAAVARDRNLDPSSVSRAIAHLEEELGIRLLQRTTRRLAATEAGLTFYQRLSPLVEEMQDTFAQVKDDCKKLTGTLRVTASVSFGLRCLVPSLPSFQSLYPNLKIDLLLTDAIVDLINERVDLGIRLGLLSDSSLIAQRLIPTRYFVCASPEYLKRSPPITKPDDLRVHNCLLFPLAGFRSCWRFRDAEANITEVGISGNVTISNAIALQKCAITGMGVALLANWLVNEDLRDGRLIDIFPNYIVSATDFHTAAWFVYPSRSYVPLKVRVFKDFIRSSLSGLG